MIFRLFKVAAGRHFGLSNSSNLNSWRVAEVPDASPCQISSKSVKLLRRYDFFIFQNGGHLSSLICILHFWSTDEAYLVVFTDVQNLVGIHAVVSIIWKFEYFVSLAWKCLFMPPNYSFWIWPTEWGVISTEPREVTSLCGKTSYDIDRQNRSTSATCVRDKKTKKGKERNLTVANWVFAQTTHTTSWYQNAVWLGGWSSSSSFKFQVSSKLAGRLPSCDGSKSGSFHYLSQQPVLLSKLVKWLLRYSNF